MLGLGLRIKSDRLASGFSPIDIPGLVLWLKADAITGLTDGAAVASWPDSSGEGNDVTQGTAINRPTYQTGEVNGLPVVRFDGSNDYLAAADFFFNDSADFTCVIVQKTTGDNILVSSGDAFNEQIRIGQSGGNVLSFFDGVNNPISTSMAVARTSFSVVVWQRASGAPKFWQNSANYDNGGTLAGTQGFRVIGIAADFSSLPTNGDIAEILFYSNALSSDNRLLVEDYLLTKYALP